jgi:hypothetical protein
LTFVHHPLYRPLSRNLQRLGAGRVVYFTRQTLTDEPTRLRCHRSADMYTSDPDPDYTSSSYQPRHRTTRNSPVLPDSAARPPTNYSQQSWLPSPSTRIARFRGIPDPNRVKSEQPKKIAESVYGDDGRETPIYARSDYDAEDRQHEQPTGTAWSRSTFVGLYTGVGPTTGFTNVLEGINEDEEARPIHTASHLSAAMYPRQEQNQPQPRHSRFGSLGRSTRSTLPSILDLEHLATIKPSINKAGDPFADPSNGTTRIRKSYTAQHAPNPEAERPARSMPSSSPQDLQILSPSARSRLGRMSQGQPLVSGPFKSISNSGESPLMVGLGLPKTRWNQVKRAYLAYRPFINAGLSLICALSLTIGLQNGTAVSRLVVVKKGGFMISAAAANDVGLGVSGWCALGQG